MVETAVGVENALSLRPRISTEPQVGLLPITELASPVVFNSNRNRRLQVVSVRRGWNNRLVNRLSARTPAVLDVGEGVFDTSIMDTNGGLNPKATPFLLDKTSNTERSSSD
jgi:hypothetical protein